MENDIDDIIATMESEVREKIGVEVRTSVAQSLCGIWASLTKGLSPEDAEKFISRFHGGTTEQLDAFVSGCDVKPCWRA